MGRSEVRRKPHRYTSAAAWNANVPPGTPVRYFPMRSSLEHVETRTRGQAWALGDDAVVVLIEGRSGGVWIDQLVILEDGQQLQDELDERNQILQGVVMLLDAYAATFLDDDRQLAVEILRRCAALGGRRR